MSKKLKRLISENATRVLEKCYLKRNPEGEVIETPDQLFRRVAENIAKADLIYDSDTDLSVTTSEFSTFSRR